jgi:outer membrane protein TolC
VLRHILMTIATLVLFPSSVFAVEDDLTKLTAEAVASNPSLDALRARERALRARAEVAGAWSDPMVAIEYSNVPVSSLALSAHPMSGLQLRVQQTLRPPGWSRLQREVGGLRADATGYAHAEAALQLRATIEQTWWFLVRNRLLRAVTEEHLARTEELLAAVRARYETGTVGQYALLRLQVLRDRLSDELGDFERSDKELSAALSKGLGRDGTSEFVTPDEVIAVAPPSDADWTALAQQHRPQLKSIDAQRRAWHTSAELARVDGLPDITVWAGYRIRTVSTQTDPGTDLVAVGVGAPIPVASGRRSRGQRAASLDDASDAKFRYESAVDGVNADMQTTLARWSRAWEKAAVYDTKLIPGGRATLQTTQADFSVGRAEFASLFEAEVMLLDLDRARIAASIQTHSQRAHATAVLGIVPSGESR